MVVCDALEYGKPNVLLVNWLVVVFRFESEKKIRKTDTMMIITPQMDACSFSFFFW